MNHIKPICGDETDILTCPHNDVEFIENHCKANNGPVVYVADGAYSMGGHAPIEALLELQQKYGLYLYFDDSHSFSVYGKYGAGYIRSHMEEVSPRTIIVASLGKAFGASGGIVMLNPKTDMKMFDRFTGPMGWSQCVNTPAMGAIQASTKIHKSEELGKLQQKLRTNIELFDELFDTVNAGAPLPIRVLPLPDPQTAIACSRYIYENGFYTSAVFFPIVAKNTAGLRVMPRADLSLQHIHQFSEVVKQAIRQF